MTLKTFKKLTITASAESIDTFIEEASKHQPDLWQRGDKSHEESVDKSVGKWKSISFVCKGTSEVRPASLWLIRKEPGLLELSNIVPRTQFQLSHDQYNSVLEDFVEKVVNPLATKLQLVVERTGSFMRMNDYVSDHELKALQVFSESANRSTGSSHPMDQERYFRFIVLAHRNNSKLPASILRRWLVEEEGWDEETAFQLSVEYENSRDLLKFYDEF